MNENKDFCKKGYVKDNCDRFKNHINGCNFCRKEMSAGVKYDNPGYNETYQAYFEFRT